MGAGSATPVCAIRDARYKLIIDPCEAANTSGCMLFDIDPSSADHLSELDDLLAGASPPSELTDLVLELEALRSEDWMGSHPCTSWVP